jgi:membrane-associated protease RseP (regulator of RpoE activity)
MQSEAHKDNRVANEANAQDINNCPNCGALMPRALRFCRACGCRLGEGVEEYTETVRFESAPKTSPAGKAKTAWAVPPFTSPTDAQEFKAVAQRIHNRTVKSFTTGLGQMRIGKACKRVPRWMVWVIVPIMIASMTGGFMSNSRSRRSARSAAVATAQNSFLGAEYKTSQGGAFIEDIAPPGSAADKAGLLGGDTITTFDGKPVRSESDLTNLLIETPVGKTVEVTYVRDGETKTAKLTTVSEKENDRLREAFDDRPEGKGFLGVDDDMARVQIPGTNIYGVRVDRVYKNRPGYIAGLRDGDIVVQFDGVPIRTRGELNQRIDRALPDSTVTVVVMRGSERLEIPVKMGEE